MGALDFRARFEAMGGSSDPVPRDMAQGATEWVRDAGLLERSTPGERALFELPVLRWTPDAFRYVLAEEPLEAVGALLWALDLVAEMPAYDTTFPPELLRMLPFLSDSPFVTEPGMPPKTELASMTRVVRLRERAALEREEQRAGLWLWRSRTTYLVHTGKLLIEKVRATIGEGLDGCATLGIPVTDDPDFLACGKAYADLELEEYQRVAAAAYARTRALRWLLGDVGWDDVPMHS
jgi:hypothetical protein